MTNGLAQPGWEQAVPGDQEGQGFIILAGKTDMSEVSEGRLK